MWNWSQDYKNLIASANKTCQNCGMPSKVGDLYVEHITPIEMHDYNTIEEYYVIMRDPTNLQVWGRNCCRSAKDIIDKEAIKQYKRSKKK